MYHFPSAIYYAHLLFIIPPLGETENQWVIHFPIWYTVLLPTRRDGKGLQQLVASLRPCFASRGITEPRIRIKGKPRTSITKLKNKAVPSGS